MSNQSALAMLSAIPAPQPAPVVGPETGANGGTPGLQSKDPATVTQMDSTRFAHLAKKEADLQKQREAYKKDQEAFQTERSKVQEINKRFNEFEALKSKDAIAAIKMLGFSDTEIMNYFASLEDTSTPEQKAQKTIQDEIQKFKDEQAQKEESINNEKNNRVITQFKQNITKHITDDKDKYEYCNHYGAIAEELIYDTVVETLTLDRETNPNAEPISAQEAADMVESFYEEQDKAMSSLKKRQPKEPLVAQPAPEAPLKAEVSPKPAAKPMPTLSSKHVATVSSTTVPKNETREEKRQRLINKLGSLGK